MTANPKPLLCYVTDRKQLAPGGTLASHIEAAMAAGVDWIQIREKDLPARALARIVSDALQAARRRNAPTRIIVNDRLDVALACGAHGVHLGAESLPALDVVAWARRSAPPTFTVGVSCHSLDEAQRAESAGAQYIFLGPIFATPSKAQFGPPLGLERLREIVAAITVPVLAIGGVSFENVTQCLAAGVRGIAAIRFFQAAELREQMENLRTRV